MNKRLKNCILNLHQIGAIRFGTFTLKSGLISPIYIDLRLIISYPPILQQIADLIWERIYSLSFERLCPVPYTAIHIATALSLKHAIPMLFRRKETKTYGTKKIIEGYFKKRDRCLIMDDLITSGSSLMETIEPLEKSELAVKDIALFLDREQGGKELIQAKGYTVHSVVTLTDLLSLLQKEQLC